MKRIKAVIMVPLVIEYNSNRLDIRDAIARLNAKIKTNELRELAAAGYASTVLSIQQLENK
jgi:hypothetical protein